MVFDELETHLRQAGLSVENVIVDGQAWLVISDFPINGGSHDGEVCDVALRRSDQNPWAPEAQIHVKPHLVAMGQRNSQTSPLGADWQYLSRRFDDPPQPHTYLAFLISALEEL
jgi:hypothetical protein